MANKIDPEILKFLLRYEPETGKLFWLQREESYFTATNKFSAKFQADRWNKKHANREALTSNHGDGYRQGTILNVKVRAHRVVWALFHGYWPDEIDHIDGDASNNRLSNLRNVDHKQNGRNIRLPSNNTSGRIGVKWNKTDRKWIAEIKVSGRTFYLGRFNNFNDASSARFDAEQKYGFHKNHGRAA